jgi:hypothetical protein
MTLTLASRISTAAMALFVVLTTWQATLAVPGLAA